MTYAYPILAAAAALAMAGPALANEHVVLDFEEFAPTVDVGEPLIVETSVGPVEITDSAPGNALAIFDADCNGAPEQCTGNDPDLYAPGQGSVLIIQDETNSREPDDEDGRVTFTFDFSGTDCDQIEVQGFWAIDATRTSYDAGEGFVDSGFPNLEDGLSDRFVGTLPLDDLEPVFQIELGDSGAIDDVEFACINPPPPPEVFLKFDPAEQSILAGEQGFNLHLQLGNPGGEPESAWPFAQMLCIFDGFGTGALPSDLSRVNKGLFQLVFPTQGFNPETGEFIDALVFNGLSEPVINGRYFDVNIPLDTSHLATGDYVVLCALGVPGALTAEAEFELNIRTQGNQDGGPVNTGAAAYVEFNAGESVSSNANAWYDSLHVTATYGNLTDVTIDGAEIVCTLESTGDAEIVSVDAWGGFSATSIGPSSTGSARVATLSGGATLQNFQNRNFQLVLDHLDQDQDTSLECVYRNGGVEYDRATLLIEN